MDISIVSDGVVNIGLKILSVAGAVIAAGFSLFAVVAGGRWLLGLFQSFSDSGQSASDTSDPITRGYYGSTRSDDGKYVTVHSEAGDRNFKKEDYERWMAGGMKGNGWRK